MTRMDEELRIGINAKGALEGARQYDRATDKIDRSSKKATKSVSKTGAAVAALASKFGMTPGGAGLRLAFAGTIYKLGSGIRRITAEAEKFQKLSEKFDTTTQFLSEMSFAAEDSGSSFAVVNKKP